MIGANSCLFAKTLSLIYKLYTQILNLLCKYVCQVGAA